MPYSLIADVVVAVLLIVTIGYAMTLNKRLGMLRRDRGELEKLAQTFSLSTERANDSLGQLQATAEILQHQIDTAQALHDDLAFLLERGEKAADRLEDTIRSSRALNGSNNNFEHEHSDNSIPVDNSSNNQMDQLNDSPKMGAKEKIKADQESSQSEAEQELLKAIRSAN